MRTAVFDDLIKALRGATDAHTLALSWEARARQDSKKATQAVADAGKKLDAARHTLLTAIEQSELHPEP